jgi:hypothetical protein
MGLLELLAFNLIATAIVIHAAEKLCRHPWAISV